MATFPGYEGYGGATITRVIDGAGVEWIGCCAKRQSDQKFGFFLFKNGVNVPISPFCSGRGTIAPDGHWIAWEGSTHHMGAIPGFTPIPKGGAMGPAGPAGPAGPPGPQGVQGVPGHAAAIPPDGMINQLWLTPYTAAECDSGEELAVKLTKNNQIINELLTLLKQAGVLV